MAIDISFAHVSPTQKGTTKMAFLAHLCTSSKTTSAHAMKRPGAFLLSDVAEPPLYLPIALLD